MQSNVISARLVIALICPLMLAVAGCQRSVGVSSPVVVEFAGIGDEEVEREPFLRAGAVSPWASRCSVPPRVPCCERASASGREGTDWSDGASGAVKGRL